MGVFTKTTASYLGAQTDRAWQRTARTAERAAYKTQLAGKEARRTATATAGKLGTLAGSVGGAIAAAALSDDDSLPSGTTRRRIDPVFVDDLARDVEGRVADGASLRAALARSLQAGAPLLLEEPKSDRSWLKGLGILAAVAVGADLASRAITGSGLIALIAGSSKDSEREYEQSEEDTMIVGGPRPVPPTAYVSRPPRTAAPSEPAEGTGTSSPGGTNLPATQKDVSTRLSEDDLAENATEQEAAYGGDGADGSMTPPPEARKI
jgi:hypothetical protein